MRRAPSPRLLLAVTACALAGGGLTGCTSPDDDDSAAPDGPFSAVVLHGPFSGDATLRATDSDGVPYAQVSALGLAGTDWALGDGVGAFWLIGRLGTDVVRRYAFPDLGAPTLEFSTGSPSNPQVVRECGDAIFVTRYGLASSGGGGDVAIFDGQGRSQGRVELSSFDEGTDGTPEPSTMVVLDDALYVGLQRLDRDGGWIPDPVGKVVAIDCASRQVTGSWDTRANVSVFLWDGAVHARGDGGIQRLDGAAFVDVLLDDDLGGDPVIGLAPSPGAFVVATEAAATGANTLWCVTPGEEPVELESPPTRAWSFAVDPLGRAWVGWRDHWITSEVEPGGIGIYDPSSCTRLKQ
jgi:hypothetical protein